MCGGREMSELGAWSSTGLPPAPIKPWYSSRARTNQGILEMRVKKQGTRVNKRSTGRVKIRDVL